MLPLPARPTDPIKLADWLEVGAVLAEDQSTSSGDLSSALRTAQLYELEDDEKIELKTRDTFGELEQRSVAAEAAYPFVVEGGVLAVRAAPEQFAAYLFCLFLSYYGWKQRIGSLVFPRRMFEDLSCLAAKNFVSGEFVSGEAVRFASPRKSLPSSFAKAVDRMCATYISEGEGFKHQPALSAKDDSVDVIAWRDSPDHLAGKLLLFGACASGNDWEDKLHKLQPDYFCEQWMIEKPVSPIIRAFFLPHRIDLPRWKQYGRRAGLLFERCRLAYWASASPGADYTEYTSWTRSILDSLA